MPWCGQAECSCKTSHKHLVSLARGEVEFEFEFETRMSVERRYETTKVRRATKPFVGGNKNGEYQALIIGLWKADGYDEI